MTGSDGTRRRASRPTMWVPPDGRSSAARPDAPPSPDHLASALRRATPRGVLRLQRAAGNAAVGRLLAPHAARGWKQAAPVVQRYEAGEHVQFGDVYEVKKDDRASKIASKLGVKTAALRDANQDKLKTWTTPDGRTVQGFNAGDTIIVPPQTEGGEATKPPGERQQVIDINGVPFTYGQVIALGDFYETPYDMLHAPKDELGELKHYLILDAASPGSVTTEQWNAATDGRYSRLVRDNASHFAPSDPALVPPSGAAAGDHKSEWEKAHLQALDLAVQGDRNAAMAANAFGDHFLTDAFAAGHLFNKTDIVQHFATQLAGNENAFFTAVADGAWADAGLRDLVSGFETTDRFGIDISNAWLFRQVLLGANAEDPALIGDVITHVVHDRLNTVGVEVANDVGSTWTLFGDKELDPTSLQEGQRAVAQSQQNVLNTLSSATKEPPDYSALNAAVWAHVPQPTAAGAATIQDAVRSLADPTLPATIDGVVRDLVFNIQLLIDEAVARGRLAPRGDW